MKAHLKAKIEDILIFYQVMKHGGFLKAAHETNTCQGKMSRRVAKLEADLDAKLFYNDMRHVAPTRAGRIVMDMAEEILEVTTKAHLKIRSEHKEIAGPMTISAPSGFGNFWLMPLLVKFMKQHPLVKIYFHVERDGLGVNTMMGEADIAISTMRPEPRESLHIDVLCQYPIHLYASKSYLQRKGTPQCLQNLNQHDFIGFTELHPNFLPTTLSVNDHLYFGRNVHNPHHAHLEVDSDLSIVTAVREGAGLSLLPAFWARSFPDICRIRLLDMPFKSYKNIKYISYLQALEKSARHQTLITFIKEQAQSLAAGSEDNDR